MAGWAGNGAYADWYNTTFSEEELRTESESSFWGKTADPDQDGIINVYEEALGLQPLTENGAPYFVLDPSRCISNCFVVSYQRSCSFDGCSFAIECTEQLGGNWDPVLASGYELSVAAASNGVEQVSVQIETSATNQFYRVVLKADG